MTDTLDTVVAEAMRAAAEQAILPRFIPGQPIHADYKAAGEAVTAADLACELFLTERLTDLIPGAHVIGEEAVARDPSLLDQVGRGTCWIIDPLDGTGNFARGEQPFGILVALADQGVPIAGWILDPVSGRLCSARRGSGAWINGERFISPAAPDHSILKVAVTRLFHDELHRQQVISVLSSSCKVLDSPRCAADQYPHVATGHNDATVFTRTLCWDHAAGVVFLEEAGGVARRYDGHAYRCNEEDAGLLIATDPHRWDLIMQILEDTGISVSGAHLAQSKASGNA